MKQDITPERVRELFGFDPITGMFTRRIASGRWGQLKAGDPVGHRGGPGYVQINVDGGQRYAHRLAWMHFYGKSPAGDIDHIDGDKTNNSIANLRDVTEVVNMQNRKAAQSNNKLGLMGVSSCTPGRWFSRIKAGRKVVHLGTFGTPELAHAAYLTAKRQLHEGCTI